VREETRNVFPSGGRWAPADWTALVESGVRRGYLPGQFLLRYGDSGSWVGALITGRVKIVRPSPTGHEIVLAIRGPGDLVGEFAHTDRRPRSASVQAIEHCIVSLVADARFTDWVARRRVHQTLDRYILGKMRETADTAARLAHGRPAQRLAALLVAIVTAGGPSHPHPHDVRMSQDDLAGSLGLARSSITPVLAEWKRRGLVAVGRTGLTVCDVDALARLTR